MHPESASTDLTGQFPGAMARILYVLVAIVTFAILIGTGTDHARAAAMNDGEPNAYSFDLSALPATGSAGKCGSCEQHFSGRCTMSGTCLVCAPEEMTAAYTNMAGEKLPTIGAARLSFGQSYPPAERPPRHGLTT